MSHLIGMKNSPKVKQLTGLTHCSNHPEYMISAIAKSPKTKKATMIIFSDNIHNNNGKRLAEYIKEQKLGDITETGQLINPNNNNTIEGWIWTIFWPNLLKWKENNKLPTEYIFFY